MEAHGRREVRDPRGIFDSLDIGASERLSFLKFGHHRRREVREQATCRHRFQRQALKDSTLPLIDRRRLAHSCRDSNCESSHAVFQVYFCCFAPMIYPANPEKTAAVHVGIRAQVRFVAGIARFTKAVRITPITSPMTQERMARNNETLFILASYARRSDARASTE